MKKAQHYLKIKGKYGQLEASGLGVMGAVLIAAIVIGYGGSRLQIMLETLSTLLR